MSSAQTVQGAEPANTAARGGALAVVADKHLSVRAHEQAAEAMGADHSRDRKLLAAVLLQGDLPDQECRALGAASRANPGCLFQMIAEHPRLDPQARTQINCYAAGLDWTPLNETQLAPDSSSILPRFLAEQLTAIPMGHGEENGTRWVKVAVADPWNPEARTELETALSGEYARIDLYGANPDRVRDAIRSHYETHATSVVNTQSARRMRRSTEDQGMRTAMIDTVERAVTVGASDVNIDPAPGDQPGARIRFRVDGKWVVDKTILGEGVLRQLLNTFRNEFKLDASNSREAQQGRQTAELKDGRTVDLRAQFMPLCDSQEHLVFRVLDSTRVQLDLATVGFTDQALRQFRAAVRRPTGCVLMCGPMGSGKTTTLYSALTELNDPGRNIVTIEDPVEYRLPGVKQTQVDDKFGITYAEALRGQLRAAPDVIMVGEIRDAETANVAMRGAVTGVLLLSTIHANSALSAPATLLQYGVEPQYVAAALLLVVSQRLVRVLCPHCRIPATTTVDDLTPFGYTKAVAEKLLATFADAGKKFYDPNPDGCGHCSFGFSGRTAIQEMLIIDEDMRDAIAEGNLRQLRTLAAQTGTRTLAEDGLTRSANGVTSLTEILATVGEAI